MLISCFFFIFLYNFFFSSWFFIMSFILIFCPILFFMFLNSTFLSKSYLFSMDLYSFVLICLTLWIVILSVFSVFYLKYKKSSSTFIILINVLFLSLILCFLNNNVFLFFFFFEATLIPILIMIIGWGYKVERLKSGIYIFFYTLFGSMPMLSIIFILYYFNKTLIFNFMEFHYSSFVLYFFSVFAFLIKMPMFFVHSWLPKAHVEAPVFGSMILAGILLKLGGYGLFRLSFIYKYFYSWNSFFMNISILGGILSSFICMRQTDLKSLIAFSSVHHMSMVIFGLFYYTNWSVMGSFLMMFSHGLCSSCLFFLANIIYERSNSRNMLINKGLLSLCPSLSFWWFMFCCFNMGAPPSMNMFSEIYLINCILNWEFIFMFLIMLSCFMSAVYNLFLYSFCNHGKIFSMNLYFFNCFTREHLICFLHFFPLLIFFLKFEIFY